LSQTIDEDKDLRLDFLALAAVTLSACNPQPQALPTPPEPIPQYDRNNPTPWCISASNVLGNPWLDDYRKQVMLEMMRNRGCMK